MAKYVNSNFNDAIKEEIDRTTWGKWVVKNVHHIEYFFNGKIVDEKTLNSLFESEGYDTDVDTVEDEIKKAVRSVRLGNLDGNTLHIAHNSVGNRIDLVFNIGGLMGDVESLSNDECVIRINGDIYEQDEMWNFGFAIYLTCDTYPMDFSLAESKKKSTRKSLKESVKPINVADNAKILKGVEKDLQERFPNCLVSWASDKDGDFFKIENENTKEVYIFSVDDYFMVMSDKNGKFVDVVEEIENGDIYRAIVGLVEKHEVLEESKKKSVRKKSERICKHLVKGLDVDFVVDHLLSLEDSDNFDLINKLSDLWEVYNKSWNKFNNFLSDFWKVMKNIEKLDSFDKTCKEIIDAWYDDIEKIFYSNDNLENFKLNYGFKGNDVFESKIN